MGKEKKQALESTRYYHGCPGGGFPNNFSDDEVERQFNTAWRNYANLSDVEDTLSASESIYGEAWGFVIVFEQKPKALENDRLVAEYVELEIGGICMFAELAETTSGWILFGVSGM